MVRPRSPRLRDGKPVKYEAPKDEPSRPYFPKRSRPQLRKGIGPIHVTEGAKKALKLSQHGYTSIGIVGTWNWKKKNSKVFGSRLALKGFSRERITGGVNKGKYAWRGLRLLTDADRELREQLGQAFLQVVNGE